MLEECTALLGLQETDLEVHKAIFVDELECGLHPPDGRIIDDHAAEAERLSRQVAQVADILIDLGLLPIEDIPHLLKIAQEVLPVVALILKRLQEARDPGAGPSN
jgi:hypothetical protein